AGHRDRGPRFSGWIEQTRRDRNSDTGTGAAREMVRERMHSADDPFYKSGEAAGLRWGREIAQLAELEHLQRLFARHASDPACAWYWYFFAERRLKHRRAAELAVASLGVDPETVDVPAEAEAFWNAAIGARSGATVLNAPIYLQGFADGGL